MDDGHGFCGMGSPGVGGPAGLQDLVGPSGGPGGAGSCWSAGVHKAAVMPWHRTYGGHHGSVLFRGTELVNVLSIPFDPLLGYCRLCG